MTGGVGRIVQTIFWGGDLVPNSNYRPASQMFLVFFSGGGLDEHGFMGMEKTAQKPFNTEPYLMATNGKSKLRLNY